MERQIVCNACGVAAGGRGAAALPAGAAAAVRVRGAQGQAGALHLQVQGPHRLHVARQGDRGCRARRPPRYCYSQVSLLIAMILIFVHVQHIFVCRNDMLIGKILRMTVY